MSVVPLIGGDSLEEQIGRMVNRPRAELTTGQITSIADDGTVQVNLGGNDNTVTTMLDIPLAVADNVLVLRQGAQLTVLGPVDAATRPMTGIVASAPTDSYEIVVTTSVGDLGCNFVASYTPNPGDTVLLCWAGSSPIVVGELGQTGSPPPPPVTPPPSRPAPRPRPPTPTPPPSRPTGGRRVFRAVNCGTYRSGWRDDDNGNVIQGTAPGFGGENHGAWFYAGSPKATLAGATVTSARIWLSRVSGGSFAPQTVHLVKVIENSHPRGSTDITFGAATDDITVGIGQAGWFGISAALVQTLIDDGGSIGIKAPSGPYVRMAGLAQSGQAGALEVNWRR